MKTFRLAAPGASHAFSCVMITLHDDHSVSPSGHSFLTCEGRMRQVGSLKEAECTHSVEDRGDRIKELVPCGVVALRASTPSQNLPLCVADQSL